MSNEAQTIRVLADGAGTMERFAARVRAMRQARKLSVPQLAELAEADTTYLYKIENGSANVSLRIVDRFGAVFGIDPGLLVADEASWQAAIADGRLPDL